MKIMNQTYIYYILVLKEYLSKNIGLHYPTEIINLIVMATYEHIYISCGSYTTTMIIKNNIYVMGYNKYGIDNIISCKDIKSIICKPHHVIIASHIPNKLYVMGENKYGQLGLGNYEEQSSLRELVLCANIKSVDCSEFHTFALLNSGYCYIWGLNTSGQLGLGHHDNVCHPQKLYLDNIMDINCGHCYTIALTRSNKCYVWGANGYGQLGLGHYNDMNTPQELQLFDIITSIKCGNEHTIALMIDGKMYAWGGQLGLGECDHNRNTPQKVILEDPIISICCGAYHTMALTKFGQLYAWGLNTCGQIGYDLPHSSSNIPQQVRLENVRSIYCGEWHTVAVTTDSTIYGWGWNGFSQLGLEHTDKQYSPTELVLK